MIEQVAVINRIIGCVALLIAVVETYRIIMSLPRPADGVSALLPFLATIAFSITFAASNKFGFLVAAVLFGLVALLRISFLLKQNKKGSWTLVAVSLFIVLVQWLNYMHSASK